MGGTILLGILAYFIAIELIALAGKNWRDRRPHQ